MIWPLYAYLGIFLVLVLTVPRRAYNNKLGYSPVSDAVGAFFGCLFWPAIVAVTAVVGSGFCLLWLLIPEFRKDYPLFARSAK